MHARVVAANLALLLSTTAVPRFAFADEPVLTLYPDASNRDEALKYIRALEATLPSGTTAPVVSAPVAVPVTPVPTVEAVVVAPAPSRAAPVYKKAWFWGVVVGGAGLVGMGLAIGLGFGHVGPAKDPAASLGHVDAP